jgi:hypothetical protein
VLTARVSHHDDEGRDLRVAAGLDSNNMNAREERSAVDRVRDKIRQMASQPHRTLFPDDPERLEVLLAKKAEIVRRKEEMKMRLKQRAQVLYSMPPGKRLAVELSIQRSGSTLLVNLFSLLNETFVLPEPHNMFDVNVTLPDFMNANATLPSVRSLLDCSFARTNALPNVFWRYACDNTQWILKSQTTWRQCISGTLDASLVTSQCKSAKLNLLKVVRGPMLLERFGIKEAIPREVKVFLLVRAPWDVFISQQSAGWFISSEMPYLAMVPEGADVLEFNMQRICSHMLTNHKILTARHKINQLIVKYEDLVALFLPTVKKLFKFLDIPITEDMEDAMHELSQNKYAQFAKSKIQTLSKDDAKALAGQISTCKEAMELFGY